MMKMWFAVGECEAEGGWQAVRAESEAEAIGYFMEGEGVPDNRADEFMAIEVPNWSGKAEIAPADWYHSGVGLSYSCNGCGEQISEEHDEPGHAVGEIVLCGLCSNGAKP